MKTIGKPGPKRHNGRPELKIVFRRLGDSGGGTSSTSAFYLKKHKKNHLPTSAALFTPDRQTFMYSFICCCCILESFLPIVPVVHDGVKMDQPTESCGMQSELVRLAPPMLPSPLQYFPVHCLNFIAVPHPRRRRPSLTSSIDNVTDHSPIP